VTIKLRKVDRLALLPMVALVLLTSCVTPEPKPEGVGRGIAFSVTPLYPNSFQITAGGSRLRGADELQEAWLKKAVMVANGRRFKVTSVPVVLNSESWASSGPLLTRSVTGVITLIDERTGGAASR
jgi:hypothetical protein